MSEYEKMKDFLTIFTSRFFDLRNVPLENRPMEALKILEEKNASAAQKGLRDALGDALTMSMRFSPKIVNDFEVELKQAGAPSLAEMRRVYMKKYLDIVQRGNISNDAEYYLIKNISDAPEISASESAALHSLIEKFETKGVAVRSKLTR